MIRFASGLLAGLFLALPAVAETTIDTARGPVSVAAVPETVAVYDVAALDTLVALGITPAGTPERVLVPYLQETAKEAAPVGTLFEPDLEALSMLAPDLVIAGGRSAPQIAQIERVAPTLDMTIGPDLLTDARARLQPMAGSSGAKRGRRSSMRRSRRGCRRCGPRRRGRGRRWSC